MQRINRQCRQRWVRILADAISRAALTCDPKITRQWLGPRTADVHARKNTFFWYHLSNAESFHSPVERSTALRGALAHVGMQGFTRANLQELSALLEQVALDAGNAPIMCLAFQYPYSWESTAQRVGWQIKCRHPKIPAKNPRPLPRYSRREERVELSFCHGGVKPLQVAFRGVEFDRLGPEQGNCLRWNELLLHEQPHFLRAQHLGMTLGGSNLGVTTRDALPSYLTPKPAMFHAHQPERIVINGEEITRFPVGAISFWRLLNGDPDTPNIASTTVDFHLQTGAIDCYRAENAPLEFFLAHDAGLENLLTTELESTGYLPDGTEMLAKFESRRLWKPHGNNPLEPKERP